MQKEAKEKIAKLVEKYEKLTSLQKKRYNESMTCKDFILPLFKSLGWDVYNDFSNSEVTSETQVSGKRVDYAFCVKDVIKFFLEAKKIDADLREERWNEQVIMYAWHKSVSWAILTDFESIRVFNSEWDSPDPERSLLFEISYKDYLTDERLWLLSRESVKAGELDEYADKNFKKPKREPVDVQLASDLLRWRDLLFKNLKGWNSERLLTDKQYAEAVQKVINRLIFIRTTEDRGFEDQKLREILRNWEEKYLEVDFLQKKLKELFKFYWDGYDSKLFSEHICDSLEYEDELLAQIINELYKNRKGIRYNFASINADVLGSVYEQYLGSIQREKNDKKNSKRKSQGIYYTPRYIVDYIVNNTLGEIIKDKSGHEATQIRVLDPACGSGSFLIKAFDVLDKHITREKYQLNAQKVFNHARKVSILTSNIYGVDLDDEAVEIARLNLLLKALEQRGLLPNLSHNVERGNSLIDGNEKELKKYFGKEWKEKKSFDWKKEFPDVFKQGGFDVVLGNPPYIDSEEMIKENRDFRKYCVNKYVSAKGNWDIFCIFLQRGIDLLKEGGYLGMIIPNKLLSADYARAVRDIINKNSVIAINDYSNIKVFGASVYPVVIIVKKAKPKINHLVEINTYIEANKIVKAENSKKINQTDLEKYKKSWSPIFSFSKNLGQIDEIVAKFSKLHGFCSIHGAATVSEAYIIKEFIQSQEDNNKVNIFFKFVNTGTIDRYTSLWGRQKTQYIKSAYLKPVGRYPIS